MKRVDTRVDDGNGDAAAVEAGGPGRLGRDAAVGNGNRLVERVRKPAIHVDGLDRASRGDPRKRSTRAADGDEPKDAVANGLGGADRASKASNGGRTRGTLDPNDGCAGAKVTNLRKRRACSRG